MKATSRLKRIDKAMKEKGLGQDELKIFFCEGTETEAECMLRNGIAEDSPDLNILVFKWASGEPELPNADPTTLKTETVADIDAKISELKNELLRDGVSDRQLTEIEASVKKGIAERPLAAIHSPDEADSTPLAPHPMRADDLSRMFK